MKKLILSLALAGLFAAPTAMYAQDEGPGGPEGAKEKSPQEMMEELHKLMKKASDEMGELEKELAKASLDSPKADVIAARIDELAKKMNWKRVLVLTYKPAVQTAWRDDLLSHVDFTGWHFVDRDMPINEADELLDGPDPGTMRSERPGRCRRAIRRQPRLESPGQRSASRRSRRGRAGHPAMPSAPPACR